MSDEIKPRIIGGEAPEIRYSCCICGPGAECSFKDGETTECKDAQLQETDEWKAYYYRAALSAKEAECERLRYDLEEDGGLLDRARAECLAYAAEERTRAESAESRVAELDAVMEEARELWQAHMARGSSVVERNRLTALLAAKVKS